MSFAASKGVFLLAGLGLMWTGSALANSVDCQKRPTLVDRIVCGSQALLNLDTAYAQAYRAAKDSADDPAQFMKLAQSDLRWRAENCPDAGCIEEWYRNVTPRYSALAANARAYGATQSNSRATSSGPQPTPSRPDKSPHNLAMGQCNVVVGMVSSVPIWRDNGVPISRAWLNVATALSSFVPDPVVMQQWERAVIQIYGSSLTSSDLSARYQSLCDQYQRLAIPAPLPR